MKILRFTIVALLLVASFAVHATILKYEMTFEASSSELFVTGAGYLFADTEKDAVIGGRFESEQMAFEWLDPYARPLAFDVRYYTADLVYGGGVGFVNEVTGERGGISRLAFLIVGPEGRAPYAAHLDNNWAGEFPSAIYLPGFDALLLDMYIDPPEVVEEATHSVPEPTALSLLALGLAAIGIRRRYS